MKLQSFFLDQTGRFSDQRLRSYETAQKRHGFLMIRLVALAAGLNSEPQNIEFRRMEALSHRGVGLMPNGPEAET
jgi:hypothetical protein